MITAIFRFMNHLQFIFRVLLLTAVQLGTGELSQLVVSIFSNKIGEPLLELLRVFKPVVQAACNGLHNCYLTHGFSWMMVI